MTEDQLQWIYEQAHREGDEGDLPLIFPDVDWVGVAERRRAQQEAEWAARRSERGPAPTITVQQINEVTLKYLEGNAFKALFEASPILGRLKR